MAVGASGLSAKPTLPESRHPKFVDKLRVVVGLYVDPPAHAIVLSVDEKSQFQALDRTSPGLPVKKGRLGTMIHDYKKHGTTTLVAVLNVLDCTVIGRNMQRHRHQDFIRFLNAISTEVPAGKAVSMSSRQLRRPQGCHGEMAQPSTLHLPPHADLLCPLNRSRASRPACEETIETGRVPFRRRPPVPINRFLAEHNEQPNPFTWTADDDKIIAAVKRGRQALHSVHSSLIHFNRIEVGL